MSAGVVVLFVRETVLSVVAIVGFITIGGVVLIRLWWKGYAVVT